MIDGFDAMKNLLADAGFVCIEQYRSYECYHEKTHLEINFNEDGSWLVDGNNFIYNVQGPVVKGNKLSQLYQYCIDQNIIQA